MLVARYSLLVRATNLSHDALKFQGVTVGWALPTILRSLQRSLIDGGQCPPYELSRLKLLVLISNE